MADIVAWHILAVLHELDREPAKRAAVIADAQTFDDAARLESERLGAGENLGLKVTVHILVSPQPESARGALPSLTRVAAKRLCSILVHRRQEPLHDFVGRDPLALSGEVWNEPMTQHRRRDGRHIVGAHMMPSLQYGMGLGGQHQI